MPRTYGAKGARLRRLVLLGLAGLLFSQAAASQFRDERHLLDPEERLRLRRELRQAHRERMRESTASGARQGTDSPVQPPAEPGRPGSSPAPGHQAEHGWPRRRPDGTWGHHEHGGAAPGRFALSDEEREQLRRQLREQRAGRRAGQSPPGPVREGADR